MKQKGNAAVIILVIVIVAIAAVAAYYFYNLSQKNQDYQSTKQGPTNVTAQSVDENDLTSQLNSIQIEDNDSSFSQVDQDIKDL